MNKNNFHKNFKLNGKSFTSVNELLSYVRINESASYSFLFNWFSSDEIPVQTSGSTGKPKVIQLKKEFMLNSALATGDFFELFENTTALLCLSPGYIAGKMMLVRALTLGWQLDIVAPTSKVNINKEYNFSAMVPMQVQNSLLELHKIKKLIVGGGVVSKELQMNMQHIKTEVFATYGMTETITHIAVKKLNNFSLLRGTRQSFYQVLPKVKIYIDARNCLVIQAPKVSKELVVTNDVVQLVSENQFEWLGRFDNVINSGGIKLHPEKIEEKLSEIITQRFFVAGIPDSTLGEKLILVIENNVTSNEVEKSLLFKIKNLDSLSKYEVPKEIYFVDTFIETETKKIQRTKTLDLIVFN
ncbi:O-succinylbenzoic acid--CoA ligase [Tenacibaculum todarodis]|uniref:O-succinylbenzoic acid--CoA ligase n=1 Tax=Tenacibaculum todarodis TaxID=1850252 RepID=A0A1L3JIF9_9FLAO|nr:AMP-binding protein [Tenacibaculum todarodis]APG64926.1 O-succinylbenzoic acid--CoA ligase [Tenacibaculum todarodis]